MGSFKLGTMTLRSLVSKPETVLYPFESKPSPAGLKGHIANDMDACILCGICQRTCPSGALTVDKAAQTWAIDRFRCVQCAACTRACPKECLTMEGSYQKPTREKHVDTLTKGASAQLDSPDKEKAAKLDA